MAFWLGIINRENFEAVKNNLIWGVSERHKKQILRTKPGDIVVFYLIRDAGIRKKTEPALGGIFEISSNSFEDHSDIFPSNRVMGTKYPYRVRVVSKMIFDQFMQFKPLIPKMSFIRSKEHYAIHLVGKAAIPITKSDFDVIVDQAINNKN